MRWVFLIGGLLICGACKRGENGVEMQTKLVISAGPNNPSSPVNIDAAEKGLILLHIKAELQGTSTVYISQIRIHATGTADESVDVDTLFLYFDANGSEDFEQSSDYQIAAGAFHTDDGYVTFMLSQPVAVTESRSVLFFVVADLTGNAADGETFSMEINNPGDILSTLNTPTGKRVFATGLPLQTTTFTVTTGGAEINLLPPVNPPPSRETVRSHPDIPVLQFRLYARVDMVFLNGVKFHALGTPNVVSRVELWLDTDGDGTIGPHDVFIKDGVFDVNGIVTISTGNFLLIKRTMYTFLVLFDIAPTAAGGVSVSCSLNDFSDVQTTAGSLSGITPITGATITIRDSGELTIVEGTNSPSGDVVARPGTDAVVVLQLSFTAVFEPVNLNHITFTTTVVGGNPDTDIDAVELWYDKDGDGRVGSGDTQIASGQTNGGDVTLSLASPFQIGEGKTVQLLLVLDIDGNAPRGSSFSFQIADPSCINAAGEYSLLAPQLSATFPIKSQTLVVLFDYFLNVGRMSTHRFQHTATPFLDPTDGHWKVLICGGFNGSDVLDTAEIYDPKTRTFQSLSSKMTTPRMNHSATLLPDGKIMISGGFDGNYTTNTIEIFDPTTRTFTPYNILLRQRREGHVSFLVGYNIYMICGFAYYNPTVLFASNVEYIDYRNGYLMLFGNVSFYRMLYAHALTDNGLFVVAGGLGYRVGQTPSPSPLDTIEVWQFGGTSSGHRILQSTMVSARVGGMAVALSSGDVLILGGYYQNPTLYNPPYNGRRECELLVDNTPGVVGDETLFTQNVGTLSEVRYLPIAVRLGDGRVLVSGGADSDGSPLASAEIYDPQNNSFSPAQGDLNTPRYGAAFCLLPGNDGLFNTPDDEVFICGGLTNWVVPLNWPVVSDITDTAEVYLP